jgi:hypothetical protein
MREKNPRVTLGYDLHPTIENDDGTIYLRSAENYFHGEYYPKKQSGEWPCDPDTGEQLSISIVRAEKVRKK